MYLFIRQAGIFIAEQSYKVQVCPSAPLRINSQEKPHNVASARLKKNVFLLFFRRIYLLFCRNE